MRPTRSRSPKPKTTSAGQDPSASASAIREESAEEDTGGLASGAEEPHSGAEGPATTQAETDVGKFSQRTPKLGRLRARNTGDASLCATTRSGSSGTLLSASSFQGAFASFDVCGAVPRWFHLGPNDEGGSEYHWNQEYEQAPPGGLEQGAIPYFLDDSRWRREVPSGHRHRGVHSRRSRCDSDQGKPRTVAIAEDHATLGWNRITAEETKQLVLYHVVSRNAP